MCLLDVDGVDECEEERLPTSVDLINEAAVAAAATATAGGDLLTFLLMPYLGKEVLSPALTELTCVVLVSPTVLFVSLAKTLLNFCNYYIVLFESLCWSCVLFESFFSFCILAASAETFAFLSS